MLCMHYRSPFCTLDIDPPARGTHTPPGIYRLAISALAYLLEYLHSFVKSRLELDQRFPKRHVNHLARVIVLHLRLHQLDRVIDRRRAQIKRLLSDVIRVGRFLRSPHHSHHSVPVGLPSLSLFAASIVLLLSYHSLALNTFLKLSLK